mgnify:FL=1
MLNEKSPDIYVGLFNIQGSGSFIVPIGVAYCYPNSSAINIAIAKEGSHRQLHNLYMYGSIGNDTSPLSKSDDITACGWQEKQSKKLLTYIACFTPEKPPDLEQKNYEDLITTSRLAVHALAVILCHRIYEHLPDTGTMHQANIPDEILNSDPDATIYPVVFRDNLHSLDTC